MVLDVAGRQTGCGEAVLLVVDGRLRAADDAALEIGVALHAHIKAAIAGLDAALLAHAGMAAVGLRRRHAPTHRAHAVADGRDAQARVQAGTVLLRYLAAGVLQALDEEFAAHVGRYLGRIDDRTLSVRSPPLDTFTALPPLTCVLL